MINVQENFKIDLRTYGRQFNIKLKVNNSDFNADNLNYIKPSFTTPLFKTIMHQIELDSKVFMSKGTKISGRIGVKVNEKNYKYIDLNNYYVQSCERQEDTNSYRVLAYSKMKEAMVDYDLSFAGKITVRNYLIAICERLGWNTDNIPATFINSEKMIDPNLHTGIKYSFRDALDEIATITCSFLMFKGDNFYLLYLTETNETIDESYLDEDNVTIGEKYLINSLVFSRAEESDNIYRKDNTSITANGLHEYRIADCQLLSTNDRADYIDEMFNYLKTLEFYIFDVQSKGILFLEACDLFNFKLNNTTYKVALLNDEINIDDGLTENLFLDKPEETETEYKYADSTDKRIDQAYILVDKQNKKITQLTEETTENSQKITKTEQDVNGLTTKVSSVEQSVENITNTQNTATGKNIHLEDSSDDPLVSIKVKGSTTQATRDGRNLFNLNNIRNSPSVFTVTETGVNLTNDWAGDVFTFGNIAKTFKANTTYTMKAKAKVVSRPSTITNINDDIFLFYRPASDELGYIAKSILGMPDKRTIALNTEKEYITSFTTPEDMTNVRFLSYTFRGNNDGSTTGTALGEIDVSEIMLVEGSYTAETFPEYEQYGASPSPDYPSEIENVEGKNKFNYLWFDTTKEVDWTAYQSISSVAKAIPIFIGKGNVATFSSNVPSLSGNNLLYAINDLTQTSSAFFALGKTQTIKANNEGYVYVGYIKSRTNYDKVKDETYYIQLEEGTVATPYTPYNSLEIKDVGENLFNPNNVSKGYVSDASGNILSISGQNKNTGYIEIIGGEKYYILSNKPTGNWGAWYDKDKKFISGITLGGNSSGIVTAPNNAYFINFTVSYENNNPDYANNVMIARSDKETPYKPYQEQKVTFPLENQKLMEGSYLASDGIHHKRKQTTVTIQNIVALSNGNVGGIFQFTGKKYSNNNVLCCDKAKHDPNRRFVTDTVYENQGNVVFVGDLTDTLETLKAKYDGAILEYELATEEIVPYTEAQQEAWDKIEQLHTYKNVTNIFSDTELDIVYVRDNGLSDMYETKQNASKNYTKTSTEIQQLDDSIKRTISQIGDRSQKTTTVTEDIDGIKNEVSNIQDLTQTTNGTKTIVLSNCVKGNLLKLQIKGNNTVFKYLYPSDDLYPSDNLLPMGDSRILVNGTVYELGITDVLRKNEEVYDEFILEKGQAKVIRRINTDGTVKTEEMTEDLGKLSISLNEGTNTIKILNYTAEITAKYAIKNDYTDIFATKVEMNSSIEQTAEGINQVVRKKVDENEIISKINQSAETVGISANKIELSSNDVLNLLAGNSINLTSKNIIISSEFLNIDKKGNMIFKILGTEVFQVQNSEDSSKRVYITDQGVVIDHSSGMDRIDMVVTGDGEGMLNCSGNGTTCVRASGITTPALTQTSKAESKKNFEKFTLEEAKKILNNTDIYKYNLKIQDDKGKKHIGFVIGDDYNYSEEITSEKNDGANIYSMTSVLYTVVKEQQKQIEELQQEIKKLEGGQDK